MVTTSKNNWIVAISSHHGNPYDGHTLKAAIEKAREMTSWKAKKAIVDLVYLPFADLIYLYVAKARLVFISFIHLTEVKCYILFIHFSFSAH